MKLAPTNGIRMVPVELGPVTIELESPLARAQSRFVRRSLLTAKAKSGLPLGG